MKSVRSEKFKKRMSFVANKTNLYLHHWWQAHQNAALMMSPRAKYSDIVAYKNNNWCCANLKRSGYIVKVKDKDGKFFWKFTTKGLSFAELLDFKLKKDRKWDELWRILIFDVPENKRKYRNFLRSKLIELGFYQLQKSVWASPWPIPKSFAWFLNKYTLGNSVHCITADNITNDKKMRKFFNLIG